VPKPQWEAAEGLALSRTQRMMKVILPQAIRIATPPTVGFMVQIIKNTSLASVVGFVELMRSGQIVNNSLFEPFVVYAIIAAVYFAMCYPLSLFSQRLERRMGRGRVNNLALA
jgi:polar amino acid transport system permease protein